MLGLRWSLSLALVCLLACGGALPVLQPPPLAGNRSLNYAFGGKLFQYDNGMRVMVVPESNTNMIKVDMRYRVGSAEDPPGKGGLAHLAEHLLFKVPSSGPGSSSIEQYLGRTALYYNAYTSWDETHFTSIAPKNLLDAMLDLESRRLRASCEHFDEEVFQHEREVVRNEIRQRSGISTDIANLLHQDVYGPDHPYHRSVGGSDAELSAITRDDVCQFVERHYTPGAAILVISGNLDPDRVLALVVDLFARLPAKPVPARAKVTGAHLRGTDSTHRLDVEQATALIAFEASRFTDYNASYDHLARRLIARELVGLMSRHRFITNYDVVKAGGVRAPLCVVAISVSEPARLAEAVDLVFKLRPRLTKELDADILRGMAENARADLIASVEPFMDEAVALADHIQYASDNRFILPRLEAYNAMVPRGLADHLGQRVRRERSHVVYIYPDESAVKRAQRAVLRFLPRDYEIEDWQTAVNTAEAERDAPIMGQEMYAKVHEFTLKNGLRVRLAGGLGYPVVDIRLVLPVGNLHEPPELFGLADLAADALQPGPFLLPDNVDPALGHQAFIEVMHMGGSISGSVGPSTTTLRIPGMSMYADGLLWQLYWNLRTGRYPRENLAIRKSVLGRGTTPKAERNRRQLQALLGALFGADHEYAHRISTGELLARVTTSKLNAFRRQHYQMRGATLIVAGEFPMAEIEAEIRRLFETLPGKDTPAPRQVAAGTPPEKPVYLAFPDDESVQTQIVLAFPVPPPDGHNRAARRVLPAMLELELSALRTKLGASYGASVSYLSPGGPRMLLITAGADRARAHEAYAAMRAALARVRAKQSTPAFVRARKQVLRRLLSDSLDSHSVASELELQAITGLPPAHWREMAEAVARLREDDLMPVIASDLDPRHLVVAIDGRRESIERLYRSAGVSAPRYVE